MISLNLKFDFIGDEILLDLGRSLVSLDKLLVVCPHDLKRYNLEIILRIWHHRVSFCQNNLFAERTELRLLLLLLRAKVLDVLDTLLQDRGLAHLVPGGVCLLAVRHQLLHPQKRLNATYECTLYSQVTCSES